MRDLVLRLDETVSEEFSCYEYITKTQFSVCKCVSDIKIDS